MLHRIKTDMILITYCSLPENMTVLIKIFFYEKQQIMSLLNSSNQPCQSKNEIQTKPLNWKNDSIFATRSHEPQFH